MGTYTELYVADYGVYSTKSQVDSTVMTIFRESDKKVFERKLSERYLVDEDDDEIEIAYEYSNTITNIIQRLNVMGFSLQKVKQEFENCKTEEVERLKEFIEEYPNSALSEDYSNKCDLIKSFAFEDWLEAFNKIFHNKLYDHYQERVALEDRNLIAKTDWNGIKLILSEIFQAFQ